MDQQPLVSIALCTYNGAAYLAAQLETLANQTYKNIEIVLVDDCSTDNTVSIAEALAFKFSNIKIYRNTKNLGFIQNFEKAAGLCTGNLIALCDQDDVWYPDKIRLQVNAIKDNILIYHDSEFIHSDGTSMNKKMSGLMNLYRGNEPEAFLFFNCVSGHSILMKKELLKYALPMQKGQFHDWWLAYVATNIGKIDFIPECLVKYRQHDDSETNILRLDREKNNYHYTSSQNFERTLNWIKYCAEFAYNKRPHLISEIYSKYQKQRNSYISFSFGFLLLNHWKSIFYIKKKNMLSKLNFIRKQMTGIKTKDFV